MADPLTPARIAILLFGALTCCVPPLAADMVSPKVGIDLASINAEGLRGPPDGRRAVHYEFCVPTGNAYITEVRAIDPTAQPMPGSRGRIGCSPEQVLVLGNTHQPDYRRILGRLSALHYVSRIEESFFE